MAPGSRAAVVPPSPAAASGNGGKANFNVGCNAHQGIAWLDKE